MKRGVMALEASFMVDEAHQEDQCAVIDALQMQQDETEQLGYTGDLSEHVQAAAAVDELVEYLDGSNEGQGLKSPEAEMLTVAVERLLKNIGFDGGVKDVAFEEQSTSRAALNNKKFAMEAFLDVLSRIWKRICQMLAEWYVKLKKVFSFRHVRQKMQRARIDAVAEAAKQASTKNDGKQSVESNETFTNPALYAKLCCGVEMPDGADMVRAVQEHNRQMRDLENEFIAVDGELVKFLEQAMSSIFDKGENFQHAIGTVYSLLMTSPIKKRSKAPQDYSKGIVLFEEPLVFGNRSYYRTGVSSAAVLDDQTRVDDMVAKIDETFISRGEPNYNAPIRKLNVAQAEVINQEVKNRWLSSVSTTQTRERNLERLQRLEVQARHLMTRSGDREVDRASKRAARLAKALGWYTKQRSSIDVSLANYDEHVRNALLDYVTESLREI